MFSLVFVLVIILILAQYQSNFLSRFLLMIISTVIITIILVLTLLITFTFNILDRPGVSTSALKLGTSKRATAGLRKQRMFRLGGVATQASRGLLYLRL